MAVEKNKYFGGFNLRKILYIFFKIVKCGGDLEYLCISEVTMSMMNNIKATTMLRALATPLVLTLGLSAGELKAEDPGNSEGDLYVEFSEANVNKYFGELNLSLEATPDAVFHRRVKAYLVEGSSYSNRLLSRMAVYFPQIEKQLSERDLPGELKYLTITESAVNPLARSRMGAVGLWQIMPGTARHLGLRVNNLVDERRDPIASTAAALDYLETLYDKYGEWEFALAAYNCGPGRLDQAIRRANSRDFQVVRRFLPMETRQYVSSFLAAVYFGNFHFLHGLTTEIDDYDKILTASTRVYDQLQFSEIAEITGLDIGLIRQLNPGILRGYIPASTAGYNLTLPRWAIELLESKKENMSEGEHLAENVKFKRVFKEYISLTIAIEDFVSWKDLGDELYLDPFQLKYLNHDLKYDIIPPNHQVQFAYPRFANYLVSECSAGEVLYLPLAVEPLKPRALSHLDNPLNSEFPAIPVSYVGAADAHHSSNRLRKMIHSKNLQGRGQSLSDAKRWEYFQANRSTAWKSAFAEERVQ